MKRNVLLLTIGLLPLGAVAQVPIVALGRLAGNGIVLASRAHKAKPRSEAPVARFRAGNHMIPQKRTPPDELKGLANDEIRMVEDFLSAAQTAYARPDEKQVCTNPTLARTWIANIQKLQPKWNVVPYQQELAFYEQEQKRRQQATPAPVTP